MKRFIVAALLAIGLVGSANAQTAVVDPDKYPNLANPIVMAQPGKLPDIAECRDVINQTVIDLVNESDVDPGEVYEANRRAHPNMIMEPPPVECASKLWNAIRADGLSLSGKRVVVPPGTEALSLRQYPVDSLFDLHASSASIGTNVNPAGGVEGYQGETAISIDPNNPQHMVAFSNTFYKDPAPACQSPTGGTANTYGTMALFGSIDGGTTWTYNCAPWPTGATGGVTGAAFWFGSDPALAWDSSGRAYACYMLISQNSAGTASGASIVVARSADNGTTWQNLGIVVNNITSSTAGDDKEMMAIDNTSGQPFSHPGRIYVIWDAANKEKIAYSDDGSTWTTVNFASNTGAIGGNVVVGADGTVYVIWNRYNVETIVFSKSTDGGATWTAPQVISTMSLQSFGTNNTPPAQNSRGVNAFGSIDIDRNPASPYFNTLYVSFPDFPTGTTTGADINTYVIRSTNGGTSWSSRVKVNDDNFGATQFFPWLSVDQSDGSVNVSWYDTRLDPLNRKTQMVYARSIDGGVSFEPNLLVTDGGSAWRNNVSYADENSVDNPTFNGNQYGDYSGIAALNRQVHPLWTDSRSFFPTADTVSPTRREDNGTSTIVNCSAPNALIAPLVNSTSAPSVVVSWSAPSSWGTNATGGTYSVYRNTSSTFPGGSPLVSGLTATSYADVTGVAATTYFYFVRATNNCPGTVLTPMSTDSPASPSVIFGNTGNAVGTLQGTVTSAGNPVSGATVTAGTLTATTNASGFYQFAAIDVGTYTVGASATGYASASVSGVTVADGLTTVQNLSLSALTASSSCFTDTTYTDFGAGTGTNVELTTSVGDVKLVVASGGPNVPDRHADDNGFGSGYGFSSTAIIGQTFTPTVTANVTKVDASLWCSGCSGTNPNITMELRTTASSQPVMTAGGLLGSSTVTGTSSGVPAPFSFTFNVPLTAGTQYAVVVRLVSNRATGTQAWSASSGDVMTGGRRVTCTTTTCSNPTGTNANSDLLFIEYNTTPTVYATSGTLVSVVRDSGAVAGSSANWSTLSWTATTPANTSVQFQAAASNSASGPFNFVGPDGTAATFFTTSGASLSQFNGKRYLKTKAILSTTDTTTTPTLSDVTVCKSVVSCDGEVPTVTPTPAQVCAGSTGNTASGPAGMSSYAWSITNGTITSATNAQSVTYTAGSAGSAVLSLTVTSASGCQTVGTATVPVNAIPAAPTITPAGSAAFCTGSSVTLTSSSATGNQWYLNGNPIGGATSQTYVASATGNYTVVATTGGCPSAPSAATVVTQNAPPAAPTIAISNLQNLTVSGSSGSFTLTFNGQTTTALAFNASAGSIQAQLGSLPTIGGVGGTVSVTGTGGVFTVTFGGTLTGPQPQLLATPGGGVTVNVTAAAVCASSTGNTASGPAGA
ncbi:MAG: carboxypeptidase regulatory-like domain-containing protein, partial [Acidobacteria bacterium]|nr:carboxypeptidase regulatory-like domain-containing protein [Acidobacteriota bacterium]